MQIYFKQLISQIKSKLNPKPAFIQALESGEISLCRPKSATEKPNALLDDCPICVYRIEKGQAFYYSNERVATIAHTFSKKIKYIKPLV